MKDLRELDKLIIGRVEPHIYAFTTNTIPNYLKVGDTYRPVPKRLKEWKEYFPNLEKKFEGSAKINNNVYFRDFSVHRFLESEKGKARLSKTDIPENVHYSKEFFKEASVDDVEEAIADIVDDYANKAGKYQYYDATTQLLTEEKYASSGIWQPRPNQDATIRAFKKAIESGRTHLLMYAVMRFGKSFTSMCCAKEMGANLVVVVSAKADVKEEWRKTVQSAENFRNDYEFFSSADLERNYSIVTETLDHPTNPKNAVVFLTLQDLQGENIKDKHQQIFGRKIDLLLVDETHFGARTEKYGAVLRTIKGDNEKISAEEKYTVEDILAETKEFDVNITIHLSGTPYRILMSDEFDKERDLIAFYQFTDIVKGQEDWDADNFAKDEPKEEWENPYYGFPQMIRFAFNPNESTRKCMETLRKSGMSDAFSVLFAPKSVRKASNGSHQLFVHEQQILDLLEVIDGSKEDDQLLGFLDYDKIKKGNMCRHIVCVLPYCASCDALEALIRNNADKFRNLNEYEIINISGVDNPTRYRTPSEIKEAIKGFETEGKKTITLTVNRMLTGSTVPEWDTMLFLKDTASPQEYDQAIFRLQNQYIKTFVNENGETIKYNMKPQTLLVDFDPCRVFVMQEQKAQVYNVNVDEAGNAKLRDRLEEELRISPIIVMNKAKIEQIQAIDILKAVSEYSKSRGVAEETVEIPVDMSLMDIAAIRAVIERENELGSKAGFTVKGADGEGQDMDMFDISEQPQTPADTDDFVQTTDTTTAPEVNNTEDKGKDPIKQFRSYYARILFFAFLTKNVVISLSDIIVCIDEPNNARIARNLGIHKDVLEGMLKYADKFVLSKLDYKIYNLNQLSHDETVDAITRASVSVQKFGKLGESEVITPKHICNDMIGMISDDDLRLVIDSGKKLLDIAGKAGEFALAICEKYFELGYDITALYNAIYTIPTSGITYEFTRMIYEILGLNVDNIAAKFTSYSLLGVKDNDGDIDYEKICKLLKQHKSFDSITLNDELSEEGDDIVNFDVAIGNPPYQEEGYNNGRKLPIYDSFMNISYEISKQAILITPARFLFNAGQTAKNWNRKMLNDEYFKVMFYEPNASAIFSNAEIKGGVAISVRDSQRRFGKIGVFTAYTQLNSILRKVLMEEEDKEQLDSIISSQGVYRFSKKLFEEHSEVKELSGNGTGAKIISKIVEMMPCVFVDTPDTTSAYVKFLAKTTGGRQYKYIKRDYLQDNDYLDSYNVMIPESNGSGAFETLVAPIIAAPGEGSADTFISMGIFDTYEEAECLLKYIKTKFARALLGVKKVTQHNPKATWEYVPMQDFKQNSDIDWSKTIAEIDMQLYAKYDLNDEEITFIETMVKAME